MEKRLILNLTILNKEKIMKKYNFKENEVLVSGHRGESCFGLENTMSAIKRALKLGVDMIETDVHMTKDRELILIHDNFLERTTNGTGLVREHTLSEINCLDATVNAKIKILPEPPPTLNSFLKLMQEYPDVLLNIELKDYPEDGEDFAFESADRICEMLIEYGMAERTWINSFSGKLLEYVYKKYGNTFYYHGFYPWFILGDMSLDPESFIDVACMQHRIQLEDGTIEKCADNMCPKEWFDHLLKKGIMPLMAPSLKEYPLYDLAFSYGSRIVNSDDPEKMIKHLRECGLHD